MLISTTTVLTDVAFTTETASRHAIRIAAAGTYALAGVTFSGFTHDIDITATSGTVTINVTGGGDAPTYVSAGATVVINAGATLTVTGVVPGSDVVVIDASVPATGDGSNVLQTYDAIAGTSVAFSHSLAGTPIKVGLFKAGLIPLVVGPITLGSSDAELPVSQQEDRNYAA
jgi:hypothetical protein